MARFILKLKESRQVTQVVIDDVVEGCTSVFQDIRRSELAMAGIDVNNIQGLEDLFDEVPQLFEDLETRHKQEKFFREKLRLVVSE